MSIWNIKFQINFCQLQLQYYNYNTLLQRRKVDAYHHIIHGSKLKIQG